MGVSAPLGVTSVNGQKGAVVTTDYGGIGSYVIALTAFTAGAGVTAGTTTAASNLNRQTDFSGNGYANVLNLSALPSLFSFGAGGSLTNLALSGTWRLLTRIYNDTGATNNLAGLYVRVS